MKNALGFQLARTALRLRASLRTLFLSKGQDITPEQFVVLNKLSEQDGCSQRDLAECVFKDTATLARMLDTLERKGVVERRRDQEDRRQYRVTITDKGRDLIEQLRQLVHEHKQRTFSCLSSEELDQLMGLLARLRHHIRDLDP